jgi:apolipoprotein N-acyltransferase
MTASIPLQSAAHPPGPTFYRRHGDWFGWACVALTLAMVVVLRRFAGSSR